MSKLSIPLICECGFNTMDAAAAIRHIEDEHPDMLEEDAETTKELGEA